jgi:hypothetical protein
VETFQTPTFSSKNVLSSDFQIKLCKRNVLFNDVSLRFLVTQVFVWFLQLISFAQFVFGISSAWWGVISISSSGTCFFHEENFSSTDTVRRTSEKWRLLHLYFRKRSFSVPALLLVVLLVMFILFELSRAAQLVSEAQLAVGVSPLVHGESSRCSTCAT